MENLENIINEKYHALLKFKEVTFAIDDGYGRKSQKVKDLTTEAGREDYKKFAHAYLRAFKIACDYFQLNPTQLVEEAKNSSGDLEKYRAFCHKMDDLLDHLKKDMGLGKSTAKSYRGYVLKLFSVHGVIIKVKHKQNTSEKVQEQSKLNLVGYEKKREVLRLIFNIADLEMKAYIVLSVASGFRPSDIVNLKMDMIKNWLNTNDDFKICVFDDIKQDQPIRACLGPNQKYHVKNFVDSLPSDDEREYLFGDINGNYKKVTGRLRDRFQSLLLSPKIQNNLQKIVGSKDLDEKSLKKAYPVYVMRNMAKSIFCQYATKDKVSLMTGSFGNDPYMDISNTEILEIFKKAYDQICLDSSSLESSKNEDKLMKMFFEKLTSFMDNQGKIETFSEMFTSLDDKKKENMPVDEQMDLKIAYALNSFKDNIVKEVMMKLKEVLPNIPL